MGQLIRKLIDQQIDSLLTERVRIMLGGCLVANLFRKVLIASFGLKAIYF